MAYLFMRYQQLKSKGENSTLLLVTSV